LTEAKRLSAGVLFKSGQTWLGPEVLQVQLEKKKAKNDQEREINEKWYAEIRKKREAYKKAWSEVSHLDKSLWSKDQLKALVNYKKIRLINGDKQQAL
jgi:hypothetical protein